MSAVLEITNANRVFAERLALQDVNLALAGGEILVLLGANGAGKTTLMRAASGRLQLQSGTVRVAGFDPATDPAGRKLLGVVPQTIALYPHLTARQNLEVFARLMGLSSGAAEQAVELAFERAGLADRADDLLGQLSGGMQRRLNIVAGTLHNPKLLLLDEPTVGVDLAAREKIQSLLKKLRDGGMAIMVSTHDFDQAARLADRVAFMEAGQMLRQGSVQQVVTSVFGDAKEGLVRLNSPASAEGAAILRQFGLQQTKDEHRWSGPFAGSYADLASLEERLAHLGLHVSEARLRDPTLAGVYMQLTGKAEEL
jgi:ABC-2 type transport system ATP-binding protein